VVDADGAEVSIDDLPVGKTPFDKPLVVNAGRRTLSITKSGYAPLTRYVDVAGTEQKKLSLTLAPLGQTGGTPPGGDDRSPLAPAEQPEGASPWPWAAFAITAAAGTTTAVLGGLAISKKSAFDDELEKVPGDPTAIEDARDDARSFAIAADVMGAVTIAGAVVTIVGFAVEGTKGTTEREARGSVRWAVGPGYVGLGGSF
jgi:hypothetical protein